MQIELWASLAQVATFFVIAVTAVAGLIQLQHLRASNQVQTIQTFFEMYEGPELREAFHFVRTELADRLEDPEFREHLRIAKNLDRSLHPEIQVCNFFDQWGGYYRSGVIDRTAFMRQNARLILAFWERLSPAIALLACSEGGINQSFEQFEYLAVRAKRWTDDHPKGDFPQNVERLPLVDRWRDVDGVQ